MKKYLMSVTFGITIFILIMNFTSCKASKQNGSTNSTSNPNKPSIIFLTLSMSYDSIDQEYQIELIDKIISEGRIKATMENSNIDLQDDFKYFLLNKNKQIISSFHMPNPLNKTVEYVDDNGLLSKKTLNLDSETFSLRIQLTADSKYISFKKNNDQLLLLDVSK